MPNDEEMFEKFKTVILEATRKGVQFDLSLDPIDVAALHGAVVLALKHPQMSDNMRSMLTNIRKRLCDGFYALGFSEKEVNYLDTRET